jgi:hypothetical protein
MRNNPGGRAYGERVTKQRKQSSDLVKAGTFYGERTLRDPYESDGRKFRESLRIL